MITNELPAWLPLANLIIRAVAFVLILAFVVRRHALTGVGEPRWITLEMATLVACFILVAGAAFQNNWLSLNDWTIVGTWGSVLLVVLAFLLLAWRE